MLILTPKFAPALHTSPSSLRAYYRRLCARLDRAKAITTTARSSPV